MTPPYDAGQRLASLAEAVRGRMTGALPALIALTDPQRTPDPLALMARLAPGSAFIYRHFGAADRFVTARRLRALAEVRGIVFLVSADRALERAARPDGVHFPERALAAAARLRARGDQRLFTGSVHAAMDLPAAHRAGLDGVLYSSVFPSASPSAGRAQGAFAVAAAARRSPVPVYALGGVTPRTAPRLIGLGLSGLACVGALGE